MILKLLGFADILAIIALLGVSLLPKQIILIMAFYLIVKGVFFTITSPGVFLANFLDILCGIYLVAAFYGVSHWFITVILTIFLLQKAFVSLL